MYRNRWEWGNLVDSQLINAKFKNIFDIFSNKYVLLNGYIMFSFSIFKIHLFIPSICGIFQMLLILTTLVCVMA